MLLLPVLLGMVGLAVDSGMAYLLQARLQSAVDAGALAGSLNLPFDPDLSKGAVVKAAKDMVKANLNPTSDPKVYSGNEVRSVCVDAETKSGVTFASFVGGQPPTVKATACAGFNNLEIVFVIDDTGSMAGTPIASVRQAAKNMVNLVLPDGMAPSAKVGLVPFRGKVHVGANVDGKADGCRNANGTLNQLEFISTGSGANDGYMTNKYPNSSCFDSIPTILPLDSKKSTIMAAIDKMTATGTASGTVIAEGIKWARHVLTPEAPYTQGGDKEKFRKVMILLTDGDNEDAACGGTFARNVDYTRPNTYWNNAYYGMNVKTCHCEDNGCLNKAMLDEATLAKAAGIEIFAVRFGDSDSKDISLMQAVTSSKTGTTDHYFNAPTSGDIDQMFKEIGKQLGWRLIK